MEFPAGRNSRAPPLLPSSSQPLNHIPAQNRSLWDISLRSRSTIMCRKTALPRRTICFFSTYQNRRCAEWRRSIPAAGGKRCKRKNPCVCCKPGYLQLQRRWVVASTTLSAPAGTKTVTAKLAAYTAQVDSMWMTPPCNTVNRHQPKFHPAQKQPARGLHPQTGYFSFNRA